jgi:hypothetical protein
MRQKVAQGQSKHAAAAAAAAVTAAAHGTCGFVLADAYHKQQQRPDCRCSPSLQEQRCCILIAAVLLSALSRYSASIPCMHNCCTDDAAASPAADLYEQLPNELLRKLAGLPLDELVQVACCCILHADVQLALQEAAKKREVQRK